jgi:hypothetical protein
VRAVAQLRMVVVGEEEVKSALQLAALSIELALSIFCFICVDSPIAISSCSHVHSSNARVCYGSLGGSGRHPTGIAHTYIFVVCTNYRS